MKAQHEQWFFRCAAACVSLCLFSGSACTTDKESSAEDQAGETYEGSPEKYPTIPDDGAVDLSVPPDSVLAGELQISVAQNEMQRFVFKKEAGQHYTIGLTALSADLDLYSHFNPDVSRNNFQFSSWAFGNADEQIDVNANQNGDYFIGVFGYASGQAKLQVFVSPQTTLDEVGWPVDWGNDSASNQDLIGGGLDWLETHDYGTPCGLVRHPGLDMNFGSGAADLGKPVAAVADGVVTGSGYSKKGWGNVITVKHKLSTGLQFESLYGHLDNRLVETGTTVTRGQQIGTVGKPPGGSPHLHFEIRKSLNLGTFGFPCKWTPESVKAAYYEPAEFIRTH